MEGSRETLTGDVPSESRPTSDREPKTDSGVPKLPTKTSTKTLTASPRAAVDANPKKAPDKKGITEKKINSPTFRNGRGSSTTSKASNGIGTYTATRTGFSGTTVISPKPRNMGARPLLSPDELVVRKTPAHVHLRSARPPGCEGESSKKATEVHHRDGERVFSSAHVHLRSARPPGCEGESSNTTAMAVQHRNGEDVSMLRKEVPEKSEQSMKEVHENGVHISVLENGDQKNDERVSPPGKGVHRNGEHVSPVRNGVRGSNGEHGSLREDIPPPTVRPVRISVPDSEKGVSSPAGNSAGGTPDNHNIHRNCAFMDRFETKEQPWKPGKKVIDHSNDQPSSEYRWKSSRKAIPGADRLQRTPELKSDEPPVSRKGPGSFDGSAAQVQREYDPFGNPMNVPENQWHPGKGRGNGPLVGEWLPPFRGYSAKAESEPPPFNKAKGSGRRHSDEYVPPFLVVDRPASWHKSKGAGSGPPSNQWLPPWVHGDSGATDGDHTTTVR
ncbi:hypothetical protein R1flu_001388 [Riccia fluitans]|uniref:Uncharacterized protein n=1 Tax=Riccia fluitans TaxID=41844 RepID=A0ABD1Y3D4_9MARC